MQVVIFLALVKEPTLQVSGVSDTVGVGLEAGGFVVMDPPDPDGDSPGVLVIGDTGGGSLYSEPPPPQQPESRTVKQVMVKIVRVMCMVSPL